MVKILIAELIAHKAYDAYYEENPKIRGTGRSPDEAIGNLVRIHRNFAGLPVTVESEPGRDIWAPPRKEFVMPCSYDLVPENMRSHSEVKKKLKTACLVDGNIHWIDERRDSMTISCIIGGRAASLGDVTESRFYDEAVKAGVLVDVRSHLPLKTHRRDVSHLLVEREFWEQILQDALEFER